MTAPPHAKCYEGKPKYKWNLILKQKYQQLACSTGSKTQTQTYCRCNLYKLICKNCHVKHVVTVLNGNNSDSSGQNDENARKRQKARNSNPKSRVRSQPSGTI